MVAFDERCRISRDGDTFNHIWIKSALRKKPVLRTVFGLRSGFCEIFDSVFKYPDEFASDDMPFALGVGDALEFGEELSGRIDGFEPHMKIVTEQLLYSFRFVTAQEPVVYKDAGELVPDCSVNEGSCHA